MTRSEDPAPTRRGDCRNGIKSDDSSTGYPLVIMRLPRYHAIASMTQTRAVGGRWLLTSRNRRTHAGTGSFYAQEFEHIHGVQHRLWAAVWAVILAVVSTGAGDAIRRTLHRFSEVDDRMAFDHDRTSRLLTTNSDRQIDTRASDRRLRRIPLSGVGEVV